VVRYNNSNNNSHKTTGKGVSVTKPLAHTDSSRFKKGFRTYIVKTNRRAEDALVFLSFDVGHYDPGVTVWCDEKLVDVEHADVHRFMKLLRSIQNAAVQDRDKNASYEPAYYI
jgi:hypothetical protein